MKGGRTGPPTKNENPESMLFSALRDNAQHSTNQSCVMKFCVVKSVCSDSFSIYNYEYVATIDQTLILLL